MSFLRGTLRVTQESGKYKDEFFKILRGTHIHIAEQAPTSFEEMEGGRKTSR